MWLRIVGGFAMATALPLAPSAQAQPSPIAVKTDKSWTHKPSGIAFPSKIDGFARSAVEDLSNGALLDTSIAYDDPISRTHVNVYVYHAAMPATAIWFDVAATMIATNDKFGRPAALGDPVAFALPGSSVQAGLRQSFDITQVGRSSGVAVIAIGEWVVKLRVTSPVHDASQLDALLDRMIAQIGWPRALPPLAAAVPLKPCPQPLVFGAPADKVTKDGASVIAGAMMGNIDRSVREKAAKNREGPAAPAYCVHPDRIQGRLPIYQGETNEGSYAIPLGDSGTMLVIARDTLTALLGGKDESSAPWTITVRKLDQWLQYPSYASAPPPAQAIEIVQSEKPLSTTSVYGKQSQISLSPDAVAN
jgi:hypothetical protein